MSEALPEAPATDTADRELAKAQLESAPEEAVAVTKDEIKTGQIEFNGEKYHVSEKLGAMPLLMWAKAQDLEENSNEALVAIYDMLEDAIHAADFKKFRRAATKAKTEGPELMEVLSKAMELITGNPTAQPDGSASS